MKVTNTQKGPRGVNTVNGPVLIEPGETVEVDIFAREKAHIEASKWFETDGDYTDDPVVVTGAPALKEAADATGSELERLQALLADRDAELAKLKAQQEEPPKTAAEVIEMAKDPNVQFMSFKAAAAKLLGADKTPAKKDEILLALEELATKPGA